MKAQELGMKIRMKVVWIIMKHKEYCNEIGMKLTMKSL